MMPLSDIYTIRTTMHDANVEALVRQYGGDGALELEFTLAEIAELLTTAQDQYLEALVEEGY